MIRTPGSSTEERGRYWTRIIKKARMYPTGITAYCRDTNVSKNSYYSWFKKLRSKHPEWEDLNAREDGLDGGAPGDEKSIDIEVHEPKQRRQFTGAFKTKILKELDGAEGGKVASILRREGLYASHINKWRHERNVGALDVKRGPKVNPLSAENTQLKSEVQSLQKRLSRATALLDLQKKVSEILGVNLQQNMDEE